MKTPKKIKAVPKKTRIKELEKLIESISEFISDADSAWIDLKDAEIEYEKLTGKKYVIN
jgi:hypothetical protein